MIGTSISSMLAHNSIQLNMKYYIQFIVFTIVQLLLSIIFAQDDIVIESASLIRSFKSSSSSLTLSA
jgi:hypothetical protein